MTAPPPSSRPPHRTGAVRADEPRRRRGGWLWWLLGLLLLLALIALAVGLYLALRGDSEPDAASNRATPSAAAPSDGSSAGSSSTPAGTAGGATAGGATTGGAVTGGTATGGAGGLVGGAGVTAAAAGSVPDGARLATPGAAGTVLFDESSAEVDAQGRQVVTAAVQALRTSGAKAVQVTGYTDVVGGQPVNGSLSEKRATAVADLLRAQLGSGVAVSTAARGQDDPVVANDTETHRQLNRRATITTS